jgi:hypothetical protein
MGWQDAPVVGGEAAKSEPAWASAPVVGGSKREHVTDEQYAPKLTGIARVGRGMMDVYQGLKQGVITAGDLIHGTDKSKEYRAQVDAELGEYEKGRVRSGKQDDFDALRLAGNLATPATLIPGGSGRTLATRVATGAAGGAAQGAAFYTPEGSSTGEQAALGAVVGAAVPVAVQGGVKAVQKFFKGKPSAVTDTHADNALQAAGIDISTAAQDVKTALRAEARKQLETGGKLDAESISRTAKAASVDPRLRLTRGQALRDPTDWQTEDTLAGVQGVGDDIRKLKSDQSTILKESLDRSIVMGGGVSDVFEAAKRGSEALKKKWEETGESVGALYKMVRDNYGAEFGMLPAKVSKTLGDAADEIEAGLAPRAKVAKSLLQKEKILDENGIPIEGASLSVGAAETLRKRLGGLISESKDATEKRILINTQRALDEDVIDGASSRHAALLADAMDAGKKRVPKPKGNIDDPFSPARKLAKERFQEGEGKVMAAAIDDSAPDSFIRKHVLSGDVRDIMQMKHSLTTGTREQISRGRQALADIQTASVSDLLNRYKVVNGDGSVSAAGLRRMMADNGKKLDALLDAKQLGYLKNLNEVVQMIKVAPPESYLNTSRTSQGVANLVGKVAQAIGQLPLIGGTARMVIGAASMARDAAALGGQRQAAQRATAGGNVRPMLAPRVPENRLLSDLTPYLTGPANITLQERER